MPTIAPPPGSITSARYRVEKAEAIKDAWRLGEPPDAATALLENPDIAADRAAALDLAYEEFCAREESGEKLDPDAFCVRFSFGASLRRLLAVHEFLDKHPDTLIEVPTTWPSVGEQVGDFRVVRELGRGGFARVYLCLETSAGDRPVAVKVSAVGSREALTLGPLSHPHLIPVFSSRVVGEWTVVAMPFVGSTTLDDVVASVWNAGRPSPPRSAAALLEAAVQKSRDDDPPFYAEPRSPIGREMSFEDGIAVVAHGVFQALAYLHERGVAHRDLKPSNVLFGPTGHPYILDFNLATASTEPRFVTGTLPYMAPEQLLALAEKDALPPADWRPADVFGCGVILFELLTGQHPFGTRDVLSGLTLHLDPTTRLLRLQRGARPEVGRLNPRVKPSVQSLIERCLALDPRMRPTASELAVHFAPAKPIRARRSRALLPLLLVVASAISWGSQARQPLAQDTPQYRPEVPPTAFAKGMLFLEQGEHGLAAGEFVAAGKADADGRAYAWAAYCLSLRKESPGAIAAANEAIRLGYRTAPVFANRAYNHLQSSHLNDALLDCEEALRLDPDLPAARYTRAFTHLQLHLQKGVSLPVSVISDIELAVSGGPITPDVWITAAQLFVLLPEHDAAWREKAARAVREAVRVGKSPDAIRRNPILKSAVAGHPIYDEAMIMKPGPFDPSIQPHVCRPIP